MSVNQVYLDDNRASYVARDVPPHEQQTPGLNEGVYDAPVTPRTSTVRVSQLNLKEERAVKKTKLFTNQIKMGMVGMACSFIVGIGVGVGITHGTYDNNPGKYKSWNQTLILVCLHYINVEA